MNTTSSYATKTACGYAQRRGRDYDETFSPVASTVSIQFIFAVAAACDLFLDQHDIRTAFLYGILYLPEDQRVYECGTYRYLRIRRAARQCARVGLAQWEHARLIAVCASGLVMVIHKRLPIRDM